MSALRVSDLHYRYGSKVALNGVSFSIDEGQFCALLGPNGAGKSTLFSLLTDYWQLGKVESRLQVMT